MLYDFDALLAVTKDEKYVTARHCLQALWKVGAAGTKQQALVVAGLAQRFNECVVKKTASWSVTTSSKVLNSSMMQ
jgi:hypothetical protein